MRRLAIGAIATCLACSNRSPPQPAAAAPDAAHVAPAPQPVSKPVDPEKVAEVARGISEDVIKKALRSPEQASFAGFEIVGRNGGFVHSRMKLTAPNAMGVQISGTWCAIVNIVDASSGRYTWVPLYGAWDCGEEAGRRAILERKSGSGWPGAADELITLLLGKKAAARQIEYAKRLSVYSGIGREVIADSLARLLIAGGSTKDFDSYTAMAMDVAQTKVPADVTESYRFAIAAIAEVEKTHRATDDVLSALNLGVDEIAALPRFKNVPSEKILGALERGRVTNQELSFAVIRDKKTLGSIWADAHEKPDAGRDHHE